MASGLNRWVAAGIGACALIALGYLPPRGYQAFRLIRPSPRDEQSTAKRRLGRLFSEFQQVNQQLEVLRFRRDAEPDLAAKRASGTPGPTLVVNPNDAVYSQRSSVAARVDTAWQQLGLGVPKVAILVVFPGDLGDAPGAGGPRRNLSTTYLLPDSTDRATCVAMIAGTYFHFRQGNDRGQLTHWLGSSLGPCAFYARFGVPGQRVRRWLDRGRFDVAENAWWAPQPVPAGNSTLQNNDIITLMWGWGGEVVNLDLPYRTIACLAGRAEACRSAIRQGDGGGDAPLSRAVSPADRWRMRDYRIIGREVLLSRIFSEVGDARFQEFWATTLPIDSALTIALREPVGEWIARWQGTIASRPRLGAAPRWIDALLSLAMVAVVLTVAGAVLQRREVR